MIVDDDAAIPVEDLAARSKEGDCLDTIPLGELAIHFVILNLQPPEPGEQHHTNADRDVLKNRDSSECEASVIAQQMRRLLGLCSLRFHQIES